MMQADDRSTVVLPSQCERALLERFLKAEAMAMWAVQAAQAQDIPAPVLAFLRHHEADEARHLRRFEEMLGVRSWGRTVLPAVPHQWCALAVLLYGYEALGLEFAKLLAAVRPDLTDILRDEEIHVGFFERQLRELLRDHDGAARCARATARAWWRKLPRTLDRYLRDESLEPFRGDLRVTILASIERGLIALDLLPAVSSDH